MIDRRQVLLGGLGGLIAPAIARAQPGPAAPGAPAPGAAPGGALPGNAGSDASRSRIPASGQRDARSSTQPANQVADRPQPPRIQALVLSQSYRGTPGFTLANTTRDAALIARAFQALRFDRVSVHSDGTPTETMAGIAAYLATLDANTIAVVYVAGHGLEIAGENLLMLEGGGTFLSLQALVQVLQQRAGVTILFLDACRNNPFDAPAASGRRVSRAVLLGGEGTVALQTVGLDELYAGSPGAPGRLRAFSLQGGGIKIVFSTDPANVAFDGTRPSSRNSPFAQALARHIRRSVSLDDIISMTTGDVVRATRRVQYPWSQGSIDRPIFLSGRHRREQASLR